MNIEKIIREKQGSIIDVRTPEEFKGGNAEGSVNIPLQEIEKRMDEFKSLKQPLIFCCASGMRSEQARKYLTQQGFECYNAGSWLDVEKSLENLSDAADKSFPNLSNLINHDKHH